MAEKQYEKTYRWMTQAFHGGDPLKLELRHRTGDSDGGVVQVWDKERWEKLSPHNIADEIIEEAKEDAKAFSKLQTYVILLYRKDREEYTSRHVFHVKGSRFDDSMEESEPPTEKGYNSQMMRHNENLARIYTGGIDRIHNQLIETNRELLTTVRELRGRELDTYVTLQSLLDKKAEREISTIKEKNNESFRQDLMAMGKRLFPMMGMKALPENSAFEQMTIEMFLETLRPEQIDKIIAILNKQQISLLTRVLMSKGQDKNALMMMIGSLDEQQYPAVMACLSPDQMGVLSEWFQKQMDDVQKKEKESKSSNETNGAS